MNKIIFSDLCNEYGSEIDRLIIQNNHSELEEYLVKVKNFLDGHNSSEYAPIFYYLGNAYAKLAQNLQKTDKEVKTYHRKALYYLRQALFYLNDCNCDKALLLCIYTNYANQLDACGRVIEALRIYRKAISLCSEFGLTLGNYGRALYFYANLVNDSGHCKELHCYAYQAIKRALDIRDANFHKQAVAFFESMLHKYEASSWKDYLSQPIVFDEYDMGNIEEQKYRKWCLQNHLFLNPLNDLINQETAFAHDPLTITHYTEYIKPEDVNNKQNGNPPKWFAMLNQLKEEYIYSRFLCYEGLEKRATIHFADKNVRLSLSSFDYVNYSIRLEQLKSAFKNLYSIFDQIAFMINGFWELGFTEKQADAEHVFKSKKYPINNPALAALYWSRCEFTDAFGDADCPYESNLKTFRNALEHKFVKIHEYPIISNLQLEDDSFYHVSEDDLKAYVLRLLELTREWIMELVYAISIEESKNQTERQAVSMHLLDFDDEWKI